MKRQEIIISIIFIFCLISYTKADENRFVFRNFQVENRLSNNTVTSCQQDKYGYIWIGTRDGLNRYDGHNFKIFRKDPDKPNSIGCNWITSLKCSHNGDLWVGTINGIYRYDSDRESFYYLKNSSSKVNDVTDNFYFDKDNNLWFLRDRNLVKYNIQLKKYLIFISPEHNYNSICITKKNEIWVGDANGNISLINPADNTRETFNLFSHSVPNTPRSIYLLYPSIDGKFIYVGYEGDDMKIFNLSTRTYKDVNAHQKCGMEFSFTCITERNKDEIWLGTDKGAVIYNLQSDKCYVFPMNPIHDDDLLSSSSISTFCIDHNQGFWAGSRKNGINYYSPYHPFHVHYPLKAPNSFKGKTINDFCADKYGHLWITSEDGGLNCLNKKDNTYTTFQPSPWNIYSVNASSDTLWVGLGARGLLRMDIKTHRIMKVYLLKDNPLSGKTYHIKRLLITKRGETYIASTGGVFKYNAKIDNFELSRIFPIEQANAICEDHLGRIWSCSFTQVGYFDPHTNKYKNLSNSQIKQIINSSIDDIIEDKQGNIWFATIQGVVCANINNKAYKRYTVKDGLPSNIINRLLEDNSGKIWISTPNGLACINSRNNDITTYTEEGGLLTRQFDTEGAFKDADGTMYFGSTKGFISFNPEGIDQKSIRLNVRISTVDVHIHIGEDKDYVVNCDTTSSKKGIVLPHQQSVFSINFSALQMATPNTINYEYRMGDGQWISTDKRNFAIFSDLPPGHYTFEVRASNILNKWYGKPTQLQITILPPWWASTMARFCYLIIILLIATWIFYSWRMRVKKTIEYNMQIFEDHKEKELYQAKIDFFINIAHEIRTPLTLIKNPLEKLIDSNKLEENVQKSLSLIDKNVSRLLSLVNQLLDFRKTETEGFKLNFMHTEIVSLITEIARGFQEFAKVKNLLLNLDLPSKELYAFIDREAVTKILSNLFSNAVKYAKSSIIVRLSLSANYEAFYIDFINDGTPISPELKDKIFEPFYRIEKDGNKPGTGLGLPLARSLAEMHNGSLRVETFNDNPGMTMFRLTLPVKLPETIKATELSTPDAEEQKNYVYEQDRATILVVEDNIEMCNFIADDINTNYNVATANNGAEAIDILNKQSIQLIISDVMMPVMDGFELLKKVKTEIEFSHIPVILLTAKNTMQSRLEGLELGADAYIEKPFSMDLLKVQISNLISNRDNIRKFYFKSPIANMKSMAYSKADEAFLEKLNAIIDEQLSNPEFDVNMIAQQLNLSRPTLYRKIRGISDLTPNELIKLSRLKKAAELLLAGDMKVYEISEAVGFSSQSYFWSAFTKQFGVSPSKYAKENK